MSGADRISRAFVADLKECMTKKGYTLVEEKKK
jgi:hypothetical protein